MSFIVFEGLDASGKSTLIKSIEKALASKKIQFVTTREPGGSPLADKIRELILYPGDEIPCAKAELLLYQASRAQHVEKVIKPALASNQWVLCDRFTPSSIAFQAGGRGISLDEVKKLNEFSVDNAKPDFYILLDLDVKESAKRIAGREEKNRLDVEKEEFHQKVRDSYLEQAAQNPEQWLILDATQPTEKMLEEVLDYFQRKSCL